MGCCHCFLNENEALFSNKNLEKFEGKSDITELNTSQLLRYPQEDIQIPKIQNPPTNHSEIYAITMNLPEPSSENSITSWHNERSPKPLN